MKSVKKELFDKIISVYPSLTPKKKRVADLILEDYKAIFIKTAKEIAQECQVSEPTIMRFVKDLGFSGYLEFLQNMKGLLHTELTSVERLTSADRQHDERTTIQKYCQNAMLNLETLMKSVSETDFKRIAETIYTADHIVVIGYRASAVLANYLGNLLGKIRENVNVDTNLSWELMCSIDRMSRSEESVLLVVLGFPRYTMRTIEVMQYANKCKVRMLGISDNPRSPVIINADQHFIIDVETVSFVDPFAHVISFLGALVHEVAFFDKAKALACITRFDECAKATHEFFSTETNGADIEFESNVLNDDSFQL